jgi:hypothetical protein
VKIKIFYNIFYIFYQFHISSENIFNPSTMNIDLINNIPKSILNEIKKYNLNLNKTIIVYFLIGGYDYRNGIFDGPVKKIQTADISNITDDTIARRLDVLLIYYENQTPVLHNAILILNILVSIFGRNSGNYQETIDLLNDECIKLDHTLRNIKQYPNYLYSNIQYLNNHIINMLNLIEIYKKYKENKEISDKKINKEESILDPYLI